MNPGAAVDASKHCNVKLLGKSLVLEEGLIGEAPRGCQPVLIHKQVECRTQANMPLLLQVLQGSAVQ